MDLGIAVRHGGWLRLGQILRHQKVESLASACDIRIAISISLSLIVWPALEQSGTGSRLSPSVINIKCKDLFLASIQGVPCVI